LSYVNFYVCFSCCGLAGTELIRSFDPWRSRLCTCPPKYSFDPYTGCAHKCIYCYASSYIRDFFNCRVKKNLIERVRRDLSKLPRGILISMSNSSDPYPPTESNLRLTRTCLELFKKHGVRLLIITKSDIVIRDIDLIKEMDAAVTMTVTTLNEELARKLEPDAPKPSRRIDALKILAETRINVGLRLDPIIPYINDEDFHEIIREARYIGVKHLVSSTFKPRHDSWKRILEVFPEIREKLEELYMKNGVKIGRSMYMPRDFRFRLMKKVAVECRRYGIPFATCREGFRKLHTSLTCDGSHLIKITR